MKRWGYTNPREALDDKYISISTDAFKFTNVQFVAAVVNTQYGAKICVNNSKFFFFVWRN